MLNIELKSFLTLRLFRTQCKAPAGWLEDDEAEPMSLKLVSTIGWSLDVETAIIIGLRVSYNEKVIG
jgi:hypothetical protein